MPFKKITWAQYELFKIRFYKASFQPLRFGQAFYNEFLTLDDEVDNIFNERDTNRAEQIILTNYVDC
jgi:hypothetical protein